MKFQVGDLYFHVNRKRIVEIVSPITEHKHGKDVIRAKEQVDEVFEFEAFPELLRKLTKLELALK